jgi:hypothetical protein
LYKVVIKAARENQQQNLSTFHTREAYVQVKPVPIVHFWVYYKPQGLAMTSIETNELQCPMYLQQLVPKEVIVLGGVYMDVC